MGGKQLGFSDDELTTAKKQTKREKFLSEMDARLTQLSKDLISAGQGFEKRINRPNLAIPSCSIF